MTLRVALFSDVHGNHTALEAVLGELERLGPFDLTICAGDLVFLGPSPKEVVERLQNSHIICLRGNCDGYVTGQIPDMDPPNETVRRIQAAHKEWTLTQLMPEQMDWLAERPVEYRISPLGSEDPDADLLVTHATPRSFHDDPRLCAPGVPAEEARSVFGAAGVRTVAFGHAHGHFVSSYDDLTLVNVSSTSVTPDARPAAAFTIATWQGDHWTFQQHCVTYDPSPEVERIRERRMPEHPWWQALGHQG